MTGNHRIVHMKTQNFMHCAYVQAQAAARQGEVPVGAIIVDQAGTIVAATHNETIQRRDPTAHAEILAIQQACAQLKTSYLEGCHLYVTLEPCPMCAQAIAFARLQTLYYGAFDPKGGGVDHGPYIFQQTSCHHSIQVFGGIMEEECGKLLTHFFQQKRR